MTLNNPSSTEYSAPDPRLAAGFAVGTQVRVKRGNQLGVLWFLIVHRNTEDGSKAIGIVVDVSSGNYLVRYTELDIEEWLPVNHLGRL